MKIEEAYEVYRAITCRFEQFDRIGEVFSEDIVSGNANLGVIRGIEAERLLLTTSPAMKLEPEDHLWFAISGDTVTFRARVWAGARGDSAFFDCLGLLIFDAERERFVFYHGFFDGERAAKVLSTNPDCDFDAGALMIERAQEASRAFENTPAGKETIPDRFRIAAGI